MEAATQGRLVQRLVAQREQWLSGQRTPEQIREYDENWERLARRHEASAKQNATEAAVLFEDALRSAPKRLQKERVDLAGLESEFAKGLSDELSGKYPPGRVHKIVAKLFQR